MSTDTMRALTNWYEFSGAHKYETFFPPDYKPVSGTIDSHFHGCVNMVDPLAQAKHASQAGMKALVIKSSPYASVEPARIVNEVLDEWAKPLGISPTICFGGLVLGTYTGGINVEYARAIVERGAKVIWLPVLTAANHLMKTKKISLEEAKRAGVYVLKNGKLIPEVIEIIDLVVKKDIALSFGHLSREEMSALADEVHSRNYTKAIIDHPFNPVTALSVADMVGMASKGININFTYFELSPYCGVPAPVMVDAIRAVGPDKTILSSDTARVISPDSVECMRLLAEMLKVFGVDKQMIMQVMSTNPARLLNI